MLSDIPDRLSPHHGSRKGERVRCLVVHADASASLRATIAWLQHPASHVSYHYSVGRTGWICRHVPDDRAAWHAGVSSWKGYAVGNSVNAFSLGVNLSNRQDATEPFPEEQLQAGAALVAELIRVHQIPMVDITMHSYCALPVGRKRDPYPAEPTFSFSDFLHRVRLVTTSRSNGPLPETPA